MFLLARDGRCFLFSALKVDFGEQCLKSAYKSFYLQEAQRKATIVENLKYLC